MQKNETDSSKPIKNTRVFLNKPKLLTPYRNSIVYELKGGTMKPLSSDYGTHDGLNPSCGIIDEFHAHLILL